MLIKRKKGDSIVITSNYKCEYSIKFNTGKKYLPIQYDFS